MFDPFSALVSTVSNLSSNLFNFFANRETNKSNQEINAASLAQQKELTEQGQQWLSRENAIARDWNSPINQKRMYMEAGINPWLAESAKIGSSASAPGVAPSVPAPSQIPMQAPKFNFDSAIQNILAAKSVDASSAANKAEAFSRFVDSIPTLSKYLGSDAVKELLNNYLPKFVGNDYSNSQEYRLMELKIEAQDYANGIALVEKKIADKYGEETAYNKMRNLSQQLVESVTHVGLMNTLAKLNDANISRNEAEIKYYEAAAKDALSRIWTNFQHGNYFKELGISEHDFRQFTASSLMLGVVNQSLDTISHTAEFKGKEYVRELMDSDWFKMSQAYGLMVDNSMLGKTLDFFTKELGNIIGVSPKAPKTGTPFGLNYIRVRETRPTINGKKIGEYWLPRD